jgi:hypothetical protein
VTRRRHHGGGYTNSCTAGQSLSLILTNKGSSTTVGKKDSTGLYSSNATLIVVPVSVLNQVDLHLIVPFLF